MTHDLDIESWKRRDHFHFYKDYERPFFNVCVELDVTGLLAHTREQRLSFFLASLYLSSRAVNSVEPLRYRLRGDRVVVHDVVHAGSTVLRQDETFGFCFFEYDPDFGRFAAAAKQRLEAFHAGPAGLHPEAHRDDVVYYSVLPWISFTSFAHARAADRGDSVPRIVFGKYRASGSARVMPVSVEVHHALADGLHVGRYLEAFEDGLQRCGELLR